MDNSQAKAPCFLCGGTEFEWHWLQAHGYTNALVSTDASAWNLFAKREAVKARLCLNCGNVLLFEKSFVDEE